MELVNISQKFEFLEDIFIGKGCDGQFSVIKQILELLGQIKMVVFYTMVEML